MSLTQKLIAAIYQQSEGTFIVTEEPQLIESLIEATELPFNGESYAAVKSRLFSSAMLGALKELGVDVTANEKYPTYKTIWGVGVNHG